MLRKTLTGISIGLLIASMAGCNGSSSRESNGEDPTSRDSATALTSVTAANFTFASWVAKDSASGTVYDPAIGKETPYVGSGTCIGCHEDFSWSKAAVNDYLDGIHVIHSHNINQERAIAETCSQCHDPIGDGLQVEEVLVANGIINDNDDNPDNDSTDGGLAAVGCENCHGPGGDHYGIGPLPYATPDNTACARCHDAIPDSHLVYHPEANNIGSNYAASRHATASVRNSAVCAKCHTDEGGKLYKNVTTRAQLTLLVQPIADGAAAVQCRTCHDPHDAGNTLLMAASRNGDSAEYNTCTTCHMGENAGVVDGTNNLTTGTTATDGGLLSELIYHNDVYYRVITDTHYDDPATTDMIEGYVVIRNENNGIRACLDCHDVHSVKEISASSGTTTINDQWAQSAHGGHLQTVKKAAALTETNRTAAQTQAIKAAGAGDVPGEAQAWIHYDWDASNRQSCQRCHTATGLKNYLTAAINGTTYTAASNDFSHLEGWENDNGTITSSGQNEMLYCWGCHADNSGGLRDPGAVMPGYKGTDGVTDAVFPDSNGSNVCLACHQGRDSGGSIKASTSNFSDTGFINSHYLSAGGTLFRTTGYEFSGQSYDNPSFFGHDQIGMGTHDDLTAWEAANGTNGPCVGCHMSGVQKHLFSPVEETGGVITAITASVCVNCHDGAHGPAFVAKGGDATAVAAAAAFLETEREELHAALKALEARLARSGFFFAASYPYFHNDTNLNGVLDAGEIDRTNGVRNWVSGIDATGKNNMGAAFNYNLLEHDPGAYAHNRFYTKRLIYDSIDFLDNGAFDQSVEAAIDAVVTQATHDGGTFTAAEAIEAKTYLDGSSSTAGVQRP